MAHIEQTFTPLNIAILTVSDTRTPDTDTSGNCLSEHISAAGHTVREHVIVKDCIYQLRAKVSQWIADPSVQVVISTGGTGFTQRDSTPEALKPLFDKSIEGFGELFRLLSYDEIGTSTIQSRAFAGFSNNTAVFCLPGSTGACKTGWTKIIEPQLNGDTRPCNFVMNLTPKHEA